MRIVSAVLLVLVLTAIASPIVSVAADSQRIEISNPLGSNTNIVTLLKKIFHEARIIVSFIIPIIVIWGAFQMPAMGGEAPKTSRETGSWKLDGDKLHLTSLEENGVKSTSSETKAATLKGNRLEVEMGPGTALVFKRS